MVTTVEKREKLVFTIPDLCRVCYTCVRGCPAKAIRIENGQAAVMHERCIACGNCVKVCSQGAKAYLKETEIVEEILNSEKEVYALLAPSFPAEFTEISNPKKIIGSLRELGFNKVIEVGFGADLIAKKFSELINDPEQEPMITSDCPGIVQYVKHFHPELVQNLSPIVSPMVATSRVIRKKYGNSPLLVFIGPCIGKKAESDEITAGITFQELRYLLDEKEIDVDSISIHEFDPPKAGKGGIFPVKRGLLQAMNIPEDLFEGQIIVAEGKANFPEAIAEFENGAVSDQNMELLCCEGCIMGPGMSKGDNRFLRRTRIGEYMRDKMQTIDQDQWEKEILEYSDLDLSRTFQSTDRRLETPDELAVVDVLKSMGKNSARDHLNCGACGYESCHSHAVAIVQGLAETDMCLPNVIEKLASTQKALKQSEKLAHMGQLSAGIAHELNNPLGVVMMYANLLLDENDDGPLRNDLELIVNQADRCKRIVGSLLNFARKNQVRKESINIAQLISDSLRSVLIPENVKSQIVAPEKEILALVDREQMMQVLTNLNKNAVEAMPDGGKLKLEVKEKGKEIWIEVTDTGSGISKENMDKLFTPFFTTKEFGKGTGLGLATTYGIVKMHEGRIDVNSNNLSEKGATGTCFTIILPAND